MAKNLTPYNGNEKYIFASYCHRDRTKVYPVLAHLQEKGCHVWYDSGINPGEDWPEVIAEKLLKSTVFIAFISQNSLMSHNCRKEINFAISKQKNILIVFLEEVALTPVMELQLSTVQAIKEYDGCGEKLLSAPVMKQCMGDPDIEKVIYETEDKRESVETVYVPAKIKGWLISIRTGERFELKDAVTYVGRSSKMCSIYMPDNPYLGRQHAIITYKNNSFYIADANSKNHTYVNDVALNEGEQKALVGGDKICLGNEEFEFILENS